MKKVKAVKKVAKHAPCARHRNNLVTHFIDEIAEKVADADGSEFHQSVEGAYAFQCMVDSANDPESAKCCLIADAIRLGYEAGRRYAEVQSLERMVGL